MIHKILDGGSQVVGLSPWVLGSNPYMLIWGPLGIMFLPLRINWSSVVIRLCPWALAWGS
jgi:hypothetical protein